MKSFAVIATHDRRELLERTLASLAQCRIPAGFGGTLVVENGRRAGAEEIVRQAPPSLGARYLFEPVGNKSRALNLALRATDDGLIIFLDDDVRMVPTLLESYVQSAVVAGRGHFFGGPVAPDYEQAPPQWLVKFLPLSARGWTPDDPASVASKPFFLGFNWAAYTDDLKRVGAFNEQFGPGAVTGSVGQEGEMQRRLVAAGVAARFVPEAIVHHWVPRDRCSADWALERAYRDGIRMGLLRANRTQIATVRELLWLVKQAGTSWLGAQAKRLNTDPAALFAAQFTYRRRLGTLRGTILKSRQPAQP
jgi:glycosyltransferase involved in cell wall biosynthesis